MIMEGICSILMNLTDMERNSLIWYCYEFLRMAHASSEVELMICSMSMMNTAMRLVMARWFQL